MINPPLRVVDQIPNLRLDVRGEQFWEMCRPLVHISYVLSMSGEPNKHNQHLFGEKIHEAVKLWGLRSKILSEGYLPPIGDQIMVRQSNLWPENGTHRASILVTLDRPVPALLVDK